MAFPLASVLAAAPGIISAAADIIKLIRHRKPDEAAKPDSAERIEELLALIEKQAVVIEELAQNNRQLALAVRNNRIIALLAIAGAVSALGVAIWF